MKKTKYILLFTALFASLLFAQEADDGFIVPLNEDFSKAVVVAEPVAKAVSGPNIKQGLWIEVASKNNSIIRNISDGTKKGYEFDNSHFTGEFNWWFWGEIGKNFHLDAEISALNFDKTLYQENTYADNVPDVSWGDGLQSLIAMFFSPVKEGNDDTPGLFNKMGFNIATPFLEARLGYGNLKENGMSDFSGIFHVIDSWDYVGNGYLELKNGSSTRELGSFKIDALAALSEMRGTYGSYDYLDIKYNDLFELAGTFGSYTTESNLFYYNTNYINAWSAYLAVNPLEQLKLEAHVLKTYGTDVESDESLAYAGRIGWKGESWSARVMQSFAGENVNSVWGSDNKTTDGNNVDYDNINADSAKTQIDLSKDFSAKKLSFTLGLDQGIKFNDYENLSEGLMEVRTQPYADFDFSELLGLNLEAGLYGVVDFDRLAKSTSEDRDVIVALDEIGLELRSEGLFGLKKVTFDYGIKNRYNSTGSDADYYTKEWTSGSAYDLNKTFHSFMLSFDFNDDYSAHIGSVIRNDVEKDATNVPLGLAFGATVRNLPIPGHPQLWVHFTYGMSADDVYQDNNYTLYRADDSLERSVHRTYLLNKLDSGLTTSQIAVGMIWALE
ncbi:MAG: hypothetical protein IJ630_03435 [Treponema sp.]|nr:hypothetical protein [Treponema sp.]